MVESYFDKLVTFPNALGQKWLSVVYHLSELTKLTFCSIILAGFASHGILNYYPTVWIYGARLANTCIPHHPSWGMHLRSCAAVLHAHPKNMFASMQK